MTDLEAANRALVLIGVAPVGSLMDHSQAARVMNGLLLDTKKVVLNEFPWSFALRIEPLTPAAGAVAGYEYVYKYPAGALNVQRVYDATGFRGLAEYRVANGVIGTHIPEGTIEYTAFVEDLDSWPRQVQECLCTRLASDAAMALSGSPQLMMSMLEKYTVLARQAAQGSIVEENVPLMRAPDYINVRTAQTSQG